MTMSLLGFTLRMAEGAADLADVATVRALAYGHHVPALRDALGQPDMADRQAGTVVLLCRDKRTGRAIGTARIQRNHPAALPIEASLALPEAIAQRPRAEITRLAILPGADPLVRPMLVKACYLYAVASQIRWLVIGARSAALVRLYRGLGFEALLPADGWLPLAHAGGLPHQVLAFDVVRAERTWHAQAHGLYPFMVETWHPDLQLLGAAPTPLPTAAPVPAVVLPRASPAPAARV